MIQQPIRFDDGAAYERMMGAWSQLVGQVFLDWLSPATGQQWIDVGCGNGAFTEQLIQRCAPAEAQGIDPSEAQLAFARTRPGAAGAVFLQGDAMVLPFEADRFDAAVMALVIHFATRADLETDACHRAGVGRSGSQEQKPKRIGREVASGASKSVEL